MDRYQRITSVTFGALSLPLPLSARLSRKAEPQTARADNDLFATSVQLSAPQMMAEVRIRGTAAAEALSLGQRGTLAITVSPTEAGKASRTIRLAGAVLTAVELAYEQASMAAATLRFAAEADNGGTDPFSAEESQ